MRALSPDFQAIIDSNVRFPAYKVYAWDSDETTISAIASSASNFDANIPAPTDLTEYVTGISWTDRQITLSMVDRDWSLFHPDYGTMRQYLKEGSIIRVVEGDERLAESHWLTTFTGQIHGQAGWSKSRSSKTLVSKVTVLGRGETQAFKRRSITSKEYSVGTDLGVAVYDLAHDFLGLTDKEMRIPFVLGRQFKHQTNQLCEVSPWDGLSALLEVPCYIPWFDGEGKLFFLNKNLQRLPNKVMVNSDGFYEYEVPERNQDSINKIIVTFIEAILSKVSSPSQKLGTAEVTTGFFSMGESLPCWWSEDRKQRADGTHMQVLKSVNSGLLPVGTESYEEIDEFHGVITVTISIWVPILATVMLMEYIGAAFIPDDVIVVSFGAGGGFTVPIGRILQAQALIVILALMMSIGSAQYEIWGTPYDYAYLERQSISLENNLASWEENELEIKNDFVGTFDQADAISLTELIYQKCLSFPRKVTIRDDPSLEVGDIIALPDGRKILVTALSKSIKRNTVAEMVCEGGKILTP